MDKTAAAKDKWEKDSDVKLYSVNNETLCQMNGVNYATFSNSHRSVCFSSERQEAAFCKQHVIISECFFFLLLLYRIANESRSAGFWRRRKTSPAWEICACTLVFVCWMCLPWLKMCYVIVTELHSSGKCRSADHRGPQHLSASAASASAPSIEWDESST